MPRIEMNLSDYLRVVRRRKRIIILSFILVVLSTIYYTLRQTPIYNSSCTLKIEQRKSVASILTELITWSPGDEMVSQANLIKSYQIMEKVAARMNLLNPNMTEAQRISLVKGLQSRIRTQQIEATNLIRVSAESSDPQQALTLVDMTARVYVETHFENKKREASNVKAFVRDQLNTYLTELQENENELQKFRQENPLVVEREITSIPVIQTDPRVNSLKAEIVQLELELIGLRSKYTDSHPEVITLKRRIEKAKSDLAGTLNELTIQQKEFSSKEIRLVQLKRNVKIAEDIYMMFKTKYEEARILEAEKVQDVTIVEPASLPSSPIKPDVNFNIMVGVLSGLIIGLIMAFIVESFDTTIGRIDDIEELIKVPVIGIIPNITSAKGKKGYRRGFPRRKPSTERDKGHDRLITLYEPTSTAAEAYKSLRTNLDYTGLQKGSKALVITSAVPEEGKTQTLVNLAIAFAQSGQRVLIVGSDFRKPMIHEIFGLKRSPGLSEVLIGKVPLDKAINTVTDMLLAGAEYEKLLSAPGIENLKILTCGAHSPNPAELLAFPQTTELIQELREQHDVVLFDSPPVLPVTDPSVLGTKTDGLLLVYQAGRTPRQALIRAKIQLENVEAKIWGVVINNVKAEFIEDVTPHQKYRYYRYYREKEG